MLFTDWSLLVSHNDRKWEFAHIRDLQLRKPIQHLLANQTVKQNHSKTLTSSAQKEK